MRSKRKSLKRLQNSASVNHRISFIRIDDYQLVFRIKEEQKSTKLDISVVKRKGFLDFFSLSMATESEGKKVYRQGFDLMFARSKDLLLIL